MEPDSVFGKVGESVASFFTSKKPETTSSPELGTCRRQPSGAFQFTVRSLVGGAIEIFASTNLRDWKQVATGTLKEENFEYLDAEASRLSHRFYRVQVGGQAGEQVVGYADITTPPGFTMLANPFRSEDPRISVLLPNLPDGSTFNKFDSLKLRLTDNTFQGNQWANPDEILAPGEGAILFNPTSEFRVVSFAGVVPQGKLLNPIPAGFSIRSSLIPKSGRLDQDLGFPIVEGDVVHLFDRDQQRYNIIPYDKKKWAADAPFVGVAESFWVGKASAINWVQEFTMT